MDSSVGGDLTLCDRFNREYEETLSVKEEPMQAVASTREASPDDTDSPTASVSSYQTSPDLATSTTVPVSDSPESRAQGKSSTSSTSSNSSNDSRTAGTSLYVPENLTPSISYDRQSPSQLLIALIGRTFDQPEKLASLLQQLTPKLPNSEAPVAKFTPFTVKRKTLCRGNFDREELKKHDLICLCYNASEARILLTGQDGYYTALLRQIEILMGPNKVAFLVSNYSFPRRPTSALPSSSGDSPDSLLPPSLRERLSQQPALGPYLERGQVLAWGDRPAAGHSERLVEIAQLEQNPRGLLGNCSVM
jgi:hypothetical protein